MLTGVKICLGRLVFAQHMYIRRPLLLTMSINGNFFFVSDIYMLQMKHLLSFGNLNIVLFYCLIVSLNNMCFLITTLNVEP